MKRLATYIIASVFSLTSGILFSGCDAQSAGPDDGSRKGIPVEVRFRISSPYLSNTRGDGSPADPVSDNEKIRNWFLVFVDKDGEVIKVLNRTDPDTGISESKGPVEEEGFKCILPMGKYTVYAFANITPLELTTATDLAFEADDKLDMAAVDAKAWTTSLNGWNITENAIPMTGRLSKIQVENTVEEVFSIEVVRMAAKVELLFTNSTDDTISVKGISIDPVTTTPISLFPRNGNGIDCGHLGNESYAPLEDAVYGRVDVTESLDLPGGTTDKSLAFYINESISDRDNEGSFTIGVKVSHAGKTEVQQYNITRDIRGYINRNDWIRIPISLSRYDVSVEALFYPPIGGFPALLSDTDPEGAQVFTFGTEGDFSIMATVLDKQTSTQLSPLFYSISLAMKEGADSEVEISGDEAIFKKKPTLSAVSTSLPDEITGELGSQEGLARLNLSVRIYDKPKTQSDAKVINTYTRPVYIIRKNLSTTNTD